MGVFTKSATPRSPSALPYSAHRAITASAQRVRLRDKNELEGIKRRSQTQWQRLAWDYYDAVAEIKFAFGLLGNVTSRIRLYPAGILDAQAIPTALPDVSDEEIPQDIKEATTTLLARISSSKGGQPALLREMAISIAVPGDCYLVQEPPAKFPDSQPEEWSIRSTDELVLDANNRPAIKDRSDMRPSEYRVLPQTAFVGRIWRSHPRYSAEADSSMKGVLDLCADLLLLTRAARATARSRLNAGAMYIPDGLSASAITDGPPLSPDDTPVPPDEDHDEFEDELISAMVTPIQDEESAAAVVPMLIRGPAELGDKIKQFKFERSFDPALAERADRILERIMQGIDVPKDIVTGLANVRYSNAIAIDETLYKAHVEPLALLISDAITSLWIRPALRELGFPEDQVRRITIWYDPSEVVMKPDKSTDADSGYDRYLLSGSAWRRAHGFTESDAPPGDELAYRMLVDKGQILPETAEMLLTHFAPEAMGAVRPAAPPAPVPSLTPGGPPTPAAPVPPPAEAATPAEPPLPTNELPPEVRNVLGLPGPAPAPPPGPPA